MPDPVPDPAPDHVPDAAAASPYRLPRSVVPSRYEVALAPRLDDGTFSGTVSASVEVRAPVREVVLNALDLTIGDCHVEVAGRRLAAAPVLDPATERLTLRLDETVPAGPATVRVAFAGTLNDLLVGFYRSTYTDDQGRTRTIATTQMQSTDCRRAFPCWDEPDLKAVFSVTLDVEAGLLAVSNAPEVAREALPDGRVRVRFADTMPMSTYLVAFVVGPLETTGPVDVDGVPVRVIHVPGKAHLTGFAFETAAFALRWFTDYYGIAYPGEKVDLVALPDFAMGAMENLGCVTFREALLLVDLERATLQEQQTVADVIAHELAHMWFGDLVTMRWWNGIWLNEAFATFMEVMAVDAFRPAWQRWTSFSLERSAAFEVDALVSTRPVEFEVVSPDDAEGMFDVLTYQKGGAVLRMLEQYLGPDRFRDGIRHYLASHAYGNTETGDLWDAIEQVTGEPVRRIMDSWIWQRGYPLVTATLSSDGGAVELRQQRFVFDATTADPTTWAVPVLVRQHADGATRLDRVLLDGDRTAQVAHLPGAAVVANAGAHGFYRVRYDAELLGRLTGPALARLDAAERYALVDDAWAAVVAGHSSAAQFCDLARAFADETELPVWQVVLGGLGWCDRFVEGDARERFRAFVRALVAPALLRLGWTPADGERDTTRELRATLVRSLAVLGADPDAVAHARALAGRPDADPSLAAAALTVVAATGDADDHRRIVEGFRHAATPQEQLRHLYALTEFPGTPEFDASLALLFSDEVRSQNAPFALMRAIRHRDHGGRAWAEVARRWDALVGRLPSSSVVRMVEGVKWLTRPEQVAEVAAFFAEHPIPQSAATLRQHLERQRVNAALRERAAADLQRYFA